MMMLSLLTGCGSKTEDSAPADSTPAEETPAEPAAAASLLEKVKTSGKLVVGTEAQYAPYEFKDLNANFAGCDMWLAQQIADHLGVELEVVDMSFDGIIPAVKSGQVDLASPPSPRPLREPRRSTSATCMRKALSFSL